MIPIEKFIDLTERYQSVLDVSRVYGKSVDAMSGATRNNPMTMIFANPRSGSTLLLRLLNQACMTRCIGDRSLEFFDAVCKVWESRKNDHTIYRDKMTSDPNLFPDEYCGYENEDKLDANFIRILKIILFNSEWGPCFMKSTVPGFMNDIIERLAEVVDEFTLNQGAKVVILQRPAEEVAESFITSPGGPLYNKEDKREQIIKAVNFQNEQFKIIADFDTIFMTYEELCADPIACLKKCNPTYTPYKPAVETVMAKKLR